MREAGPQVQVTHHHINRPPVPRKHPRPDCPSCRHITTLPLPSDTSVAAPGPSTHTSAYCRRCGRAMRHPTPSGLGPVCERQQRQRTVRATIPAPRPDDVLPGQTELALGHQPTLWSL